jgi:hypothetical protein
VSINRLQGSNEVGKEADRVVVLRFEREPGDRHAALSEPLCQQCSFAKPGGCRDKNQCALHALLKALDEVRAADQAAAWTGSMKLGREQQITLDAWSDRWDGGGIHSHGYCIEIALCPEVPSILHHLMR